MTCHSLHRPPWRPVTPMSSHPGDVPRNRRGAPGECTCSWHIPCQTLRPPQAPGCPLTAKNHGTPGVSKLLQLPVRDTWAAPPLLFCPSVFESVRQGGTTEASALAGGLCKILNVSARCGGHTGCFSGLCPGSPSQQGCWGRSSLQRDPAGAGLTLSVSITASLACSEPVSNYTHRRKLLEQRHSNT